MFWPATSATMCRRMSSRGRSRSSGFCLESRSILRFRGMGSGSPTGLDLGLGACGLLLSGQGDTVDCLLMALRIGLWLRVVLDRDAGLRSGVP